MISKIFNLILLQQEQTCEMIKGTVEK